MEDGKVIPGSLFVYAPNQAAPVFFAIAYGASAVGHIWQAHHYKAFKLIGLHPFCASLLCLGYALREYASFNYFYNTSNLIIYILSQVFIYVCPPMLELANYHVLGRICYYIPYLSPLPPGKVLSTFGILMGLVETLNSLGVSLSANPSSSHSTQELGGHLTLVAIGIQLAVILIFVVLAIIFHRRCIKAELNKRAVSVPLRTMYMSMTLIFIRCIYRLIEHVGNTSVNLDDPESLKTLSPILRYEWYFYVFEATLIFINSVLWNVWHPGRFLPRNNRTYLAQDGVTEVQTEDQSEHKSIMHQILNVLTFGVLDLLTKKSEKRGSRPEVQTEDQSEHKSIMHQILNVLTFGVLDLLTKKSEKRGSRPEVQTEDKSEHKSIVYHILNILTFGMLGLLTKKSEKRDSRPFAELSEFSASNRQSTSSYARLHIPGQSA